MGSPLDGKRMNIAYYLVLFLHIVACLFLIGVVLLSRARARTWPAPSEEAAPRPPSAARIRERPLARHHVLAGLFMVTSLALSMLRPHESSILRPRERPLAAPGASAAARSRPCRQRRSGHDRPGRAGHDSRLPAAR
jgi:preprotein translocase subunit SecG